MEAEVGKLGGGNTTGWYSSRQTASVFVEVGYKVTSAGSKDIETGERAEGKW